MGYMNQFLHECYMLYKCWINLKYQTIIYQLGINFINVCFELHFLSFNKIMFIMALFRINWIIKLVTCLKCIKLSVITTKILQHYIALLYSKEYQYQMEGKVQLTVIHMHDMCSLVCGCTWGWLFISLGIIKWDT